MKNFTETNCQQLRRLSTTMLLQDAIAKALRDLQIGDGIWRFFSDGYPGGGVIGWNQNSDWK
jgi:hypothetical protein